MSPSTKTKDDEPKLTLPVGHPKAGYVEPDLSYHDSTGVLPEEEIDFHEKRNEAREADLETIADGEHQAALEEQEAREETDKKQRELTEQVASGKITQQQADEQRAAQAKLDATKDTTDTSSSSSTPAKSSS